MNHPRVSRRTVYPAYTALAVLLAAATGTSAAATVHRIGSITWHPKHYAGQVLDLIGYPLARKAGYVLFSDEPHGRISAHDLPVTGKNIADLKLHERYSIQGLFVRGGLVASNGNPYHLELTAVPKLAPK